MSGQRPCFPRAGMWVPALLLLNCFTAGGVGVLDGSAPDYRYPFHIVTLDKCL